MFGLEGVPSGNDVSPLHPENYTGERNANEMKAKKKTLRNFTGILGFKERRQRNFGNGMERRLTAKKAKARRKSGKKRHTADA